MNSGNNHNRVDRHELRNSHNGAGRNTTSFALINVQVLSNNHNASFVRNSSKVILALCLAFGVAIVASSKKKKLKLSVKAD